MLHAFLSLPTDGGERMTSQTRHFNLRRKYFKDDFTNKALQSEEKIFQSLSGFDKCHW
jgi:hypothetical protein